MIEETGEATSEDTRSARLCIEPKGTRSSKGRTVRKSRSLKPRRLPRGVLVRVDVLEDEHGAIVMETLERLSPGFGYERRQAASLLVQAGVDVLEDFREERDSRGDSGDDGEEDDGSSPTGPHRPNSVPEPTGPHSGDPEALTPYRVPPPSPDTQRTYG
jgi:hypothetical protein